MPKAPASSAWVPIVFAGTKNVGRARRGRPRPLRKASSRTGDAAESSIPIPRPYRPRRYPGPRGQAPLKSQVQDAWSGVNSFTTGRKSGSASPLPEELSQAAVTEQGLTNRIGQKCHGRPLRKVGKRVRMHPMPLGESGWVWVGAGSRAAGLRTGRVSKDLRSSGSKWVRPFGKSADILLHLGRRADAFQASAIGERSNRVPPRHPKCFTKG